MLPKFLVFIFVLLFGMGWGPRLCAMACGGLHDFTNLSQQGHGARKARAFDSAEVFYERALLCDTHIEEVNVMRRHFELGRVQVLGGGQYHGALEHINKAYKLAAILRNRHWQVRTAEWMGNAYYTLGHADSSLLAYNQGLEVMSADLTSRLDSSVYGSLLNEKGYRAYTMGLYTEALAAFDKAEGVLGPAGDSINLAWGWYYKGWLLKRQGVEPLALGFFTKAKGVFERQKQMKGQLESRNALAVMLQEQGKYNEALSHYGWILCHTEKENEQALFLNNLGEAMLLMDSLESAYMLLDSSMRLWQGTGMVEHMPLTVSNLGRYWLKKGNKQKALTVLGKGLVMVEANENRFLKGVLLLDLGRVTLEEGNLQEGWNYLNKALQLVEVHEYAEYVLPTYQLARDFAWANQDMALYHAYTLKIDSVSAIRSAQAREVFRAVVNENAGFMVEEEKEKRLLSEVKAKVRGRFLTIFGGLLLLLVLLLLVISRANWFVKRKNIELEEKNDRISHLIQEMSHRVKNHLGTLLSLLSMQERRSDNAGLRLALNEGKSRINAILELHSMLHDRNPTEWVPLRPYFLRLVNGLFAIYKVPLQQGAVQLEDAELPLDQVLPLGVVVTELVTNALKYGVPSNGEGFRFKLSVFRNEICLVVADAGEGLVKGCAQGNAESFGLNMAFTMVERQLNGRLVCNQAYGTEWTIALPASHA